MKKQIGQLTDDEFKEVLRRAPYSSVDYVRGRATTKYGKGTYNHWVQHPDKSWTNYSCNTK